MLPAQLVPGCGAVAGQPGLEQVPLAHLLTPAA
jgi:hypothetical protein